MATKRKKATTAAKPRTKFPKILKLSDRDIELAKLAKGGLPAKPKKPSANASDAVVVSFIDKHNAYVKGVKAQAAKGKVLNAANNALGNVRSTIKNLKGYGSTSKKRK